MSDLPDTPTTGQVGDKIARGIKWTTVGTVITNATRLIVVAALGRLPDDFAMVARVMAVFAVVSTLRDLGLGPALIQHRNPGPEHIRTVYTVSLLIGLFWATAIFLAAPLLAMYFRSPDAVPFMRALAGLVLLRSASSVALQLCTRDMNFRASTLSDLVAYFLSSVTAITAAALGLGPWSQLLGYLVEGVLLAVWLMTLYPPPRPGIDRAALRELFGFGAGQTVSSMANTLATYGDNLVVGRLPGDALGFYSRAYELVRFPAATFQSLVGTVLFPGLSRLQDNQAELGVAFRRTLFSIAALLLPASVVLIVLAPEFIELLLGGGWGHAVLPFQVMAAGMLFRTNYKAGALIARARGDIYAMATLQVGYAIVVVGGAIFSLRWGITGVATTTTLGVMLFSIAITALGARHAALGVGQIIACHVPAVGLAIVVGAVTAVVAAAMRATPAPGPVVLIVAAAAGGVAFLAAGARWIRAGHPEATWLWQMLRGAGRKVAKRAARR
jgi:O-antigen/teichoic acid export membrane protein